MKHAQRRDRDRQRKAVKRELQREFTPELELQQKSPGTFGRELLNVLTAEAYGEDNLTDDNPSAGLVTSKTPSATAKHERLWANKAADLDIDVIRRKDRSRYGGIIYKPEPRKPDGISIQSLWECEGEKHSPLCDCAVWINGRAISPESVAA